MNGQSSPDGVASAPVDELNISNKINLKDDGGSSRRRLYVIYVVILLTLSNILSYADRQVFAILLPSIKNEFQASDAVLGLLGGPAFMVAYVLFSLPLAALADRTSRRAVLAFSVMTWSAATAWCGMASSILQLTIGRIGVGIGEAGGSPPAQSLISSTVSARNRSLALGVFTTGTYFGVVAGMWGGAALDSAIGWRDTFLVLAAPGVVIALLIYTTLPRRTGQLAVAASQSMLSVIRYCWAIRSLRCIMLGAGIMNIFTFGLSVWMPSYLMRSHGLTLMEAGFWNGVTAALGGIIGSLAGGYFADRFSEKNNKSQMLIPAIGMFCAAPFFAMQLLWPVDWVWVFRGEVVPLVALLTLPASFFMGLWMPAAFGAIQNLVRAEFRAQAAACLIVVLFLLGGTIGPIFTGFVSDYLSPIMGDEALRYAMLSSIVTLLMGGGVFLWGAGYYPKDLANPR